jgi:hypothetical protein
VVHALSSGWGFGMPHQQAVALVSLSMILVYSAPLIFKTWIDRRFRSESFLHAVFYAVATIVMLVYISSATPDFIYFQF